jgi:predicted nucleotidyltransferase
MMKKFENYAGIKVLNYFLKNPSTKIYIKGLSRELIISSATSKTFCDQFEAEKFLTSERIGNVKLFYLNNDSTYVREMKRVFALMFFRDSGIDKIFSNYVSFAIYGSYANGEYDESSDLDLLLLVRKKGISRDKLLKFEKKIGVEIQLTELPYYTWEKEKKEGKNFCREVLEKHILIGGEKL